MLLPYSDVSLLEITVNFNFSVPADWHGVIKRKYTPHPHSRLQPLNFKKFSSKLYIQRGWAPSPAAWLCQTSGGFAPFRSSVSPVLAPATDMVR